MSSINLLVALPAEAKPIVAWFGLERSQPDLGFPLYRNHHVALIVTGSGKINAAAASGFLGALNGNAGTAAWVNMGIAGHPERPVGEVLLASSIRDAGSGEIWHPTLPPFPPVPAVSLVTLDRPDPSYEQQDMMDMEASGFFPAACRFGTAGLVQVLKVISDNRRNDVRGVNATQVHRLMDGAIEKLDLLLARLEAPAGSLFSHAGRIQDG